MTGQLLEEVAHEGVKAIGEGGVPVHERGWMSEVIMEKHIGGEEMVGGGLNADAEEGSLGLGVVEAVKDLFGKTAKVVGLIM